MDFSAKLPVLEAGLGRSERYRIPGRFGDMTAPELSSVQSEVDRGILSRWADFCEYAIGSDAHLTSLHTTRVTRVVQAEFAIVPNQFGDPALAKLAAEFVNECIGKIDGYRTALKNILNAIPIGYSGSEMEWERDHATKTNFVRRIHYRHPHRFRYDDQWRPRLYDHGTRRGSDQYGEILDPRRWIFHIHQEQGAYPNTAGVMRPVCWYWMFGRWVDKYWIQAVEKFGQPFLYAKVDANTPAAVRQEILDALQDLANDHAATVEGGDIEMLAAAVASSGESAHKTYREFIERSMTKAWLGTGDAVDPAQHGSNDGASTRVGATMDPRMVADGLALSDTLQRTMFRQLLSFNLHKFGNVMPPIPEMAFKTSGDEVKVDRQDEAAELQSDGSAAPYAVNADDDAGAQPEVGATDVQETALNGAQVSSLVEIVQSVARGELPRASGVQIIQVAFQVDLATAERLMGEAGRDFVISESGDSSAEAEPPEPAAMSAPDPKALSRPSAGRRTVKQTKTKKSAPRTSRTSSRSPGPLERALLEGSGVLPR